MESVRKLTSDDLDWLVARLAERRAALVPHAPVYWRSAAHADQAHRRFLDHVLTTAGGIGYRTEEAVMIAAPGRGRWTIDDAAVPEGEWQTTGRALWDAIVRDVVEGPIRVVCPTPETERTAFVRALGLQLDTSWWHLVVDTNTDTGITGAGDIGAPSPQVDGAHASVVPAPRIYDPGGPILYLDHVTDAASALPAGRLEADRLGCPVLVVDQPVADVGLVDALGAAGFNRHCDFFSGQVGTSPSPTTSHGESAE